MFETVCFVGTGFSEVQLADLTAFYGLRGMKALTESPKNDESAKATTATGASTVHVTLPESALALEPEARVSPSGPHPSVDVGPSQAHDVCDVWFAPCLTFEVKFGDITRATSTQGTNQVLASTCARNYQGLGLSLRFPRFLHVRIDKAPEACSTSADVEEFYDGQFQGIQE